MQLEAIIDQQNFVYFVPGTVHIFVPNPYKTQQCKPTEPRSVWLPKLQSTVNTASKNTKHKDMNEYA